MGAWIVIHMARSQREAQRLSDKLTDERHPGEAEARL